MFKRKMTADEIDRFLDQYTIKANHVVFRGVLMAMNNGGFLSRWNVMSFTKRGERKDKRKK